MSVQLIKEIEMATKSKYDVAANKAMRSFMHTPIRRLSTVVCPECGGNIADRSQITDEETGQKYVANVCRNCETAWNTRLA